MRFADKVALVTGGASGIGRATVNRLNAEGCTVVTLDKNSQSSAPASDFDPAPGAVHELGVDVTQSSEVDAAVELVIARCARIDILVTAAGINLGKALIDTDDATYEQIFAVNVKGTLSVMRAVLPHMVRNHSGAVVTVASQLAYAGGLRNAAYIASKGAIVSLTKAAALEHAEDGVRINSVAPGATQTPLLERSMQRQADPTAARARSSRSPRDEAFGRGR